MFHALLVEDGRVLLLPRPPTGIWGGLLSLPEVENAAAAESAALKLGCKIRSKQALTPLTHTFTHFRLTITPLVCEVKRQPAAAEPGARWLAADELTQAPLPTPVRKLLSTAFATNPASRHG